MAKWYIMGFFWPEGELPLYLRGERGAPNKFSGEVDIESDGRFKGSISDQYGHATIVGTISTGVMIFDKRYQDVPRGGAQGKIRYSLRAHRAPTRGERWGTPAGWKGIWQTEAGAAQGETACLLFPVFEGAGVTSGAGPQRGEGTAEKA